jgi:uncharacterized membrane protein YdbT with pleckstrin-like domain
MSYIRKHLMAGEVVAREARLSRILYLPAFFAWTAAIVSLVIVLSAGETARQALAIPAVLAAVGLILALVGACRRAAAEFAVTNKRVVVKTGILRNRSSETLLRQVEGITVDQGIFGRIFNYGTIVIEGTGTDKVPYKQIGDPLGFRLSVLEQIDKGSSRGSAPPMPHDAEQAKDPYFALQRMNALRQKGILSDEEFQREKRKILGTS